MESCEKTFLRVGELAKLAGKTVRAIHLYEELGLLKPAERSRGGYRLYGPEAITRLEWIAKLQDMGFSLPDIQAFVHSFESSAAAPAAMQHARSVFEAKLLETRSQLERLRALERDLEASLTYLASCTGCKSTHQAAQGCCGCENHGHQQGMQPELVAGLAASRAYDLADSALVRRPKTADR